jgi:hypothetical protein
MGLRCASLTVSESSVDCALSLSIRSNVGLTTAWIEPPRVAMGTIKARNDIDLVYDITLRRQ